MGILLMLTRMSMILLCRKAQLRFTELVQMLLFLSASCHCLHQRKESEELPTIREKGRLARQVLHNTVVEGVTAVGFVPSVFIL